MVNLIRAGSERQDSLKTEVGIGRLFEIFSGEARKDGLERRLERYTNGYKLLEALKIAKETGSFEGIGERFKSDCIDPVNRKTIFDTVKEQDWSNIFSRLEAGDSIAMLLSPGANFLSIKELNNIFGEAGADAIRDERNIFIEQLKEKYGYEVLYLDFSRIVLKNVSGLGLDEFRVNLENLCRDIDEHVSGFITSLANQISGEISDGDKKKNMVDFLSKLDGPDRSKNGYQMTFGVDSIRKSEEADLMEIVLSLDHCLQLAQCARENFPKQGKSDKILHGDIYNFDVIQEFFEEIKNARSALISGNISKTININGESVAIFEKLEGGYLKLNGDVLRAYRKGKIDSKDQEGIFNLLNLYIKRLNLFDFMKPYLNEELDEELRNGLLLEVVAVTNFDRYVSDGEALITENLETLINMLESDPKDRNCSSRFVFYGECLEKDGFFVKFDVVDVWGEQIQYFEQLSQEIDLNGFVSEETKIKVLSATDKITKKLRSIRKIIREEIGSSNMEVGGDEVLTFVSSNVFSQDLVFRIQERCLKEIGFNVRAVIREKSGNTVADIADDIISIDHGIEYSKKVEDRQRKIGGSIDLFYVKVGNGAVEVIPK